MLQGDHCLLEARVLQLWWRGCMELPDAAWRDAAGTLDPVAVSQVAAWLAGHQAFQCLDYFQQRYLKMIKQYICTYLRELNRLIISLS